MLLVIRIFAAFVLCAQLAGNATAGFVDFENFSDGDSLTTEIPGLTFIDATVLTAGVSLNEIDFPPHSGSNVIASFGGVLTVNFDTPVSFVSGFMSYADSAGVNLSVYDLNNMLLADAFFGSPLGPLDIVSNQFISLEASNIRRMVVSLNSPISDNPFTLDDLNSVPEPTTVSLLIVSLLSVGLSRFRKASFFELNKRIKTAFTRGDFIKITACFKLIILSLIFAGEAAADFKLFQVQPTGIELNVPTPITFVAEIAPDPKLIRSSVNLLRQTPQGWKVVGTMYDDGLHGDSLANDNRFTLKVNLNEPSVGQVTFRASAAYKGILKRDLSSLSTLNVHSIVDQIALKPIANSLLIGKDKLVAEATVSGLGVSAQGVDVEFSIQGLGTITSRSGVTDAQGKASVEFLDFPLSGQGQLLASVKTSKGTISDATDLTVVGAPSLAVQQSRAQIDIKEGEQASYTTTIDFTPGVGDNRAYQILTQQTINPDDGGLIVSPIDSLTSNQPLQQTVPVTYTALKSGTYAVTTTASVVPVGGDPNSKALTSQSSALTVGVFKPEVDQPLFLGTPTGNPSAIEAGTTPVVVFSTRLTGSNQPPAEIALWEVEAQNQKTAIGNLLDNGENGDLVKGDGFYSGTFTVDAINEGEKRYQVTAEYQNSTILSPVGALNVTSRPIGPVPIAASQAVQDPDTGQKYAPGEILVKFKSELSNAVIDAILAKQGAKVIGSLPEIGVLEIAIPDADSTAIREAVAVFRQLSEVVYAEPNILLGTGAAASTYNPCPNTPSTNCDWAIEKVRAPEAWTISKGVGARVAVVDANGVDANDMKHGDHVAALISKIAPEATITPYFGFPYASYAAKAINQAAVSQSTVINLSIWENCGDSNCSFLSPGNIIPDTIQSIKDAIKNTEKKDILFVGIAGNHGNTLIPALAKYLSDSHGLVVGATNFNDQRARRNYPVNGQGLSWPTTNPGSGYGSWVDIAAPGENVCVEFDTGGNCIQFETGTSYAAPLVSGAAALLFAQNPSWSAADVTTRLKATATPFNDRNEFCPGEQNVDNLPCAGLLNIGAAINFPDLATSCPTLNVSDFLEAELNGTYQLLPGTSQAIWEQTGTTTSGFQHSIMYSADRQSWDFLFGEAGRPALCELSSGPGNGPFECLNWREWRGSGLQFPSVGAQLQCNDVICSKLNVSGFQTQALINGDYTRRAGTLIWENNTHQIVYGRITPTFWEFISIVPDKRQAICSLPEAQDGPFVCNNWQEWRGETVGYISVNPQLVCATP